MTDREENAFRDALQGLVPDDESAPTMTRRPRPVMPAVLAAAAIVLLVSVIGLPRIVGGGTAEPASGGAAQAESAQVPQDSAPTPALRERAPTDWRTEYFRDISFSVPPTWGYAVPPQSDWCADNPQGEPRRDQRTPYVWLAMDIPVRAIGCPDPMPDSLLTEHVEAVAPGPATDYVEGEVQQAGWWIVTRFVGSAVLIVTTRDHALAEQILDSADVVGTDDSPERRLGCSPASPVAGPLGARPASGGSLDDVDSASVESAVVCQYEPVVDAADADLPRLRAVSVRQGDAAQALVDRLRSAPEQTSGCDHPPVDDRPDVAIVVRIAFSNDGVREIFVAATGCPDGDSGMVGGIDDGTQVRVLTRTACQSLLVEPLVLFSASGAVAANCLG